MDDLMEYNLTSSKPQAEIIRSRLLGGAKILLARIPLIPSSSWEFARSRSLYQINDSRFVRRLKRVRSVEARRKKGS